jgi:hypothetical protein
MIQGSISPACHAAGPGIASIGESDTGVQLSGISSQAKAHRSVLCANLEAQQVRLTEFDSPVLALRQDGAVPRPRSHRFA